jgi:hypothetical protein
VRDGGGGLSLRLGDLEVIRVERIVDFLPPRLRARAQSLQREEPMQGLLALIRAPDAAGAGIVSGARRERCETRKSVRPGEPDSAETRPDRRPWLSP